MEPAAHGKMVAFKGGMRVPVPAILERLRCRSFGRLIDGILQPPATGMFALGLYNAIVWF